MKLRCFVCVNGHVWTINDEGKTNFPADIHIEGNTVQILGARDDLGPGRAIDEEYQLWNSLTDLAIAIEHSHHASEDGSVSLAQAVGDAHKSTADFEKMWILQNKENPEQFPMVFPADNAGLWAEQMASCDDF